VIVVASLAAPGAGTDLAIEIARRAAREAKTELVGIVAPDPPGDRLLAGLSEAGVGHAAVMRDRPRDLEPADLELALRYLPDVRAVVIVRPAGPLLSAAAAAASWSGASLVVVADPDRPPPADPSAIVLQAPRHDPDGAFAGVVAALAARLDGGADPTEAWRTTSAALGISPLEP
jgi:hypothetical protein